MTREEYAARIEQLIADAKSIDSDAAKAAYAALKDAHTELLREIAALPVNAEGQATYSRVVLQGLQRAVDRSMNDFERRMEAQTKSAMADEFDKGRERVDRMMQDAIGIPPSLAVLPRHNLILAQAYTADLVTNLSTSAKAQLNAVLRRSALGGETPYQIMKKIGVAIGEGDLGKISRRAQTIYRTEVGRMGHAAAQARLEEAGTRIPGLEKQWIHAGILEKHPRSYHLMIHGQHVPVNERFAGSGPHSREDLMYPGDPRGAAEDTVNCLCDMTAWTPALEKFAPLTGSRV